MTAAYFPLFRGQERDGFGPDFVPVDESDRVSRKSDRYPANWIDLYHNVIPRQHWEYEFGD